MTSLHVYIGGDPVGQPRARHIPGVKTPVSTADKRKKIYRAHVIGVMKRRLHKHDWTVPKIVEVSWISYNKTRDRKKWGHYCDKKPDRDNSDKLILDCAQKAGIIRDDKSVAEGTLRKVWSRYGGWTIIFRSLDGALPPDPDAEDLGAF